MDLLLSARLARHVAPRFPIPIRHHATDAPDATGSSQLMCYARGVDRGDAMASKGKVYKRGACYWIAFKVGGKRYRMSTGLDDEQEAARYLKMFRLCAEECVLLGLEFRHDRGLEYVTKTIESEWIRLNRIARDMRERGFLW